MIVKPLLLLLIIFISCRNRNEVHGLFPPPLGGEIHELSSLSQWGVRGKGVCHYALGEKMIWWEIIYGAKVLSSIRPQRSWPFALHPFRPDNPSSILRIFVHKMD